MLRLPPFRLHQPTDLGEACRILEGEGPAARVLAGGTDLLPNLKRRHQSAAHLVNQLLSMARAEDDERDEPVEAGLSAAVYTQTADVENEVNGYVTYDRRAEKMDFQRVRAAHLKLLSGD